MSQEIILEAKNINKSFSGIPVLRDVHLDVRKGEVHALMGENGAGKSTLIKDYYRSLYQGQWTAALEG